MNDNAPPSIDWPTVRRIFLRWEWLRIAYNAVLAAVVVVLIVQQHDDEIAWASLAYACAVGAVVANLCFFAGPLAEAYLHWLGARLPGVTVILFSMGTVFAAGLAAVAILSILNAS
jgi:hypothetical protein